MDEKTYQHYVSQLQGRERKSYNGLLAYVNKFLPKDQKLPKNFTDMSIPEDNIKLYTFLKGDHKITAKANKDFNTRELDIEVTGLNTEHSTEIKNILKGYQDMFRKFKDINNEDAFNTRIFKPFVAELEDYYVANLPELLYNIVSKSYTLRKDGSFVSGKSEDIPALLEDAFKREQLSIAIAPYAADWVGVHAYVDPNNNNLQKQITFGFDTKTQKIENLKAGAQLQDPVQLHQILSESGVFNDPKFSQETMLKVYNKYVESGEFGRLYKNISNHIYNTYKNEIAHGYMQAMYGPTAVMFFTTDTGFYSLSQLLTEEKFSYELDPKGFDLSKDFKFKFEEWGKSEAHYGYNTMQWGWISYLKGYAKYKGD